MKLKLLVAAGCASSFFLAGCATMPQAYIPETIGPREAETASAPLIVTISPDSDTARIGDLLYFKVGIRNSGEEPIWIPRNPDLIFSWVYSNGIRDNHIREFATEKFYSHDDAVLLKPGQQIVKRVLIKTYYFPRPGITEFQAHIHFPLNRNPELEPFWHGDVSSHAYGVMMRRGGRREPISGELAITDK